MKKYCTYKSHLPSDVDIPFFLFNIITVINSYFVDTVSFALPNYNKEKTEERRDRGYCFLVNLACLFCGNLRAVPFLPCINTRYIMLWKKKIT